VKRRTAAVLEGRQRGEEEKEEEHREGEGRRRRERTGFLEVKRR